jgi:hypothetical protein
MFQDLSQQLLQTLQSARQDPQQEPEHQEPHPPDEIPEDEPQWASILEDLPAAPVISESSWPKIYKLAKELKRRALLMTAGRDLHDIHTVLFMAAQWTELHQVTRNYVAHRMRLLHIAITKGWSAALFYDQQGTDEFLDVSPEFWSNYQPPARPKTAQRGSYQSRGRSSTRRGRGKGT